MRVLPSSLLPLSLRAWLSLAGAALLFRSLSPAFGFLFRSFSSSHLCLSMSCALCPELFPFLPSLWPWRFLRLPNCHLPSLASYIVCPVTTCLVFTYFLYPMSQLFFLCKFSACVIWQVLVACSLSLHKINSSLPHFLLLRKWGIP